MDEGVLVALTSITNLALGGYLPQELQTHLCGGKQVPLLKKDCGIRPLVVGECLRAIIAKAEPSKWLKKPRRCNHSRSASGERAHGSSITGSHER